MIILNTIADQVITSISVNITLDLSPFVMLNWQQMMEVLSAVPCYQNLAGAGKFSARPGWRPLTKFEQRGQRLGHGVWDLLFVRRESDS